jgi:hypothetical protein
MGSVVGRVGNKGGYPLFDFTEAGQDTGALLYGIIGIGWKDFLFQLIGAGTGLAVTLYGTIHEPTALGLINPATSAPYAEWFVLPAPSTEASAQWNNPISPGPTTCANYVKAPILAVRATSAALLGATPAGTSSLIVFVTS